MVRVTVIGARGRMGVATLGALAQAPGVEIAGTVDRGEDLRAALAGQRPTVAIDFTEPGCVAEHLAELLEAGVHPVIGTTGLTAAQIESAVARSRELQLGGLIAPNFSIGAVLMMELARRAAPHLPSIEIIECHHPRKKDAPSGTALRTRQQLEEAAGGVEVPIHSLRLPGFVARQEVVFGGPGERLMIAHEAIDRECYLPGVLLGVRRVPGLQEIVVGLEQLLRDGGDGGDGSGLDP